MIHETVSHPEDRLGGRIRDGNVTKEQTSTWAYEEVILAWLRGQWVHQARLTIGWQFHWPFPSKAFLFQTSGPSLILQAKELNLYSLSPSLHGYLLVWALLHWEMSPFSQNQNRGTLEGTASCLPKPSLFWLKTESHLVPGHISAHPTLQLDVCIRSLDRRHGNGSFAFDFQKAVLQVQGMVFSGTRSLLFPVSSTQTK